MSSLKAGMTEEEMHDHLGIPSGRVLKMGSGPQTDYRIGYSLGGGTGLYTRWDRTQDPARLKQASLIKK
jgi:hypothetical protein